MPTTWRAHHAHAQGSGKNGASVLVRLSIDLQDGSHVDLVSDTTWTSGIGPMVAADIYQGETYNASKAVKGWDAPNFDAATNGWLNCTVGGSPHNLTKHPWDRPSVIATHAPLPQIEVTGTASPIDFWQAAPNSWVFDFGVNRAGVTTLAIPGSVANTLGSGAAWTQKASEALLCDKPCGINHYPAVGANEITTFISDPALNNLAGAGAGAGVGAGADADAAAINFTPRFTQYGFRYIQLNFTAGPLGAEWASAGGPSNSTVTMQFINTAATPSATIEFSDVLLQQIQDMSVTSAASNWMSVPTDCPQRAERLGWMGDAYTSGETQLHNFDLAGAYTSFLDQIEDNMPLNASDPMHYGAVPDCVPFYGGHCHLPSSPSWGQAYPSLANWVYEYYNDLDVVAKHYPYVKLYADSLTARAKANDKQNQTLLDTGGWGDWCAPSGNIGKSGCGGTGTCGGSHDYISTVRIVKSWAGVLGNAKDLAIYTALEAKIRAAFDSAYYVGSRNNDDNDSSSSSSSSVGDSDGASKGTDALTKPPAKSGYSCSATRSQTANALGLQVSPGADGAVEALLADVKAQSNHLDTGIVGTKWLFESLAQSGQ